MDTNKPIPDIDPATLFPSLGNQDELPILDSWAAAFFRDLEVVHALQLEVDLAKIVLNIHCLRLED